MDSLTELQQQIDEQFAKGETLETSRKLQRLYQEREQNPVYQLQRSIVGIITELESKLDTIDNSLVLTDEERQQFLEKAIEQVTPYYEQKKAEIEAGIREGSVRTAEDTLLAIRQVQDDTRNLLQKFDVDQAQTEEEFLNNMAYATSRKDQDLNYKRVEWKQRIENAKMNQVQTGIFASGVGRKKLGDLAEQQQMDVNAINSDYQNKVTGLETDKKYNLEQITMAREAAERDRIAKIGTPEQVASLTNDARTTLGLQEGQDIGSAVQVQADRANRNIPIYNPTDLTTLNEQRTTAVESRNQELQSNELAVREQREKANREKILGELAYQRSRLGTMGY